MAPKKEQSLQELAQEMLVTVKKDQEWLTGQKMVLADIQDRIDECFKKAQGCDLTKGVYSTTQMAKELGMSSAQKLYEELRDTGIVFNQGYEWMLTSPYSTYQLTEVTTRIVKGKYIRRLLWSERGRRFLLALKDKNVICTFPKPKIPKSIEAPTKEKPKEEAKVVDEVKTTEVVNQPEQVAKVEVEVKPVNPLVKKAETLKDEIHCLLSLINEVGNGETMLLMGDIMTISTTISEHVSTLAFEAYKTLNAPTRA